MRRPPDCLTLLSLLATACTGSIGGSSAGDPGGDTAGQPSSRNSGGSGGNASGGVGVGVVAREACSGPAPELRRLSHSEYDNAVRDLLGEAARPGRAFPSDTAAIGVAETRSVSPLLFEGYESTARKLIEAAWARDKDRMTKGQTPFLRTCDLSQADCPRALIARFARLAWRRPVLGPEVDALLKMTDVARELGDGPEVGITAALQVVLLAPDFIFQQERIVPGAEVRDGFAPVDPYAMAAKLAAFLWNSTPDERLLDLAHAGGLQDASSIEEEARRMLADRKAEGLVESFVASWLGTSKLDKTNLDKALFPAWNDTVKQALKAETVAFIGTFFREKSSALDMLDAEFTFANETSAPLYGLSGIRGADLQRVKVDGVRQGGLLTHAGLLAMTSLPTRTSPARRGSWVSERFLCVHPPPPPPDVNTNPPPVQPNQTLRQRLQEHQDKPACRGCHALMDPIGFGLEAYDAAGTWRTTDNGVAIDSAGSLPGTDVPFTGGRGLGRVIKENAAEEFTGCVARNLLAHAIGRPLDDADEATMERLYATFAERGFALRELALAVTASKHMTHRCVGGQTPAERSGVPQ